jgi:hypothetical protein
VADASFAFVRRHHLRRLALSLVLLSPQHHLSPLHLPPSREGKEDRRPLKWTQRRRRVARRRQTSTSARRRQRFNAAAANADKRSTSSEILVQLRRRRQALGAVEDFDAANHRVTGFPRSIGHFEVVESHHFARRGPPPRLSPSRRDALSSMQFATIKGLRKEKYTLQSQNWRESAKTNKTYDLLPPAATWRMRSGKNPTKPAWQT